MTEVALSKRFSASTGEDFGWSGSSLMSTSSMSSHVFFLPCLFARTLML